MSEYLDEIRGKLQISKVVARKVQLKQRGPHEFVGLCPFHAEKSPSFTVSDDKRFYHCFGCGKHGDVISFIAESEGIEYKQAAHKLAQELGIAPPQRRASESMAAKLAARCREIHEAAAKYYHDALFSRAGMEALHYLKSRGLNKELISHFRLGYADTQCTDLASTLIKQFGEFDVGQSKLFSPSKYGAGMYPFFRERIMFPITDAQGRVIAFGGRTMSAEGQPKYINSSDSPCFKKGEGLYNISALSASMRSGAPVLVVEGYMDVISLHKAGYGCAVAPLGTAIQPTQLELIWRYSSNPILFFDGDNAGLLATKRAVLKALPHITHNKTLQVISMHGYKDPDELVRKLGPSGVAHAVTLAEPMAEFVFRSEMGAGLAPTPEGRSKLRMRLTELSECIKDSDLRRQYHAFFREKFSSEMSARYSKSKDGVAARRVRVPLNSEPKHDDLYIKLLGALAMHPQVLEQNAIWEQVVGLELESNTLQKVVMEVLTQFEKIAIMDADLGEKGKLYSEVSLEVRRLFPEFEGFEAVDSHITTADSALSYVARLLALMNLRRLEREIETLSSKVVASGDEADFARLLNLKNAHENLKMELGII